MKKILSLMLVGVMVFSMIPAAYATNVYENPDADTEMGTAVSYTADSDANREYTITVPASLDPGASGTVTLKGKWASNETVKVTADANVVLTNSINAADKHTLDVTFLGIEKAGNNTAEKTYTETVKVAAMPADALFGTWSGKFNYNVEFDTAPIVFYDVKYMLFNPASITPGGEYTGDWVMIKSDGQIYQGHTDTNPDGTSLGSYTKNGQTFEITTGEYADTHVEVAADGTRLTVFYMDGGCSTPFLYTP